MKIATQMDDLQAAPHCTPLSAHGKETLSPDVGVFSIALRHFFMIKAFGIAHNQAIFDPEM